MGAYTPDSNRVVHYTYADMTARQIVRPVHLVQYDQGLPIIAVKLYNDGLEYTIPMNATVNIRCGKVDGNFVYNPALGWDSAMHTVYFEVTKQMTALAGEINPIVEIELNNKIVSSGAIAVQIDFNPVQEQSIRSTTEYLTAKQYAEQAVDAAAKAASSASQASGYANTASSKASAASTSAANAKNYADSAASSENAAASSASNASASATNAKKSETTAANSASLAQAAYEKILEAVEFAGLVSAINHRNVYRGKNLGSSVTAAQRTAIQNGTFDDLFIGDYWVIGGVTWVIADMDYFLGCGDISDTALTKHHLVIVPATSLYDDKMNATDKTEGGYVGSVMYKTGLDNAKAKFKAAFGDMLLTHRTYLVNAVANGKPSGGAWFDETVALMPEVMVYGTHYFEPANDGTTIPTKSSVCNSQLALMQLNPRMIKTRENYWLQNVVSSDYFALAWNDGYAYYGPASFSFGVRPYGIIG